MKKQILLAALLLVSLSAAAQETTAQVEKKTKAWSFVPKVGANFAWMTNDDAAETNPRIGLVLGGEFNYRSPKSHFGFSFGMLYSQQGIKEKDRLGDLTAKLDYLNFPLLLNYHVNKSFTLKFGLQPALNVKHSAYLDAGGGMTGSGEIDKMNSFDLSIPMGFSVGDDYLMFDVRFNLGVTNWHSSIDSNHRVVQLTVGYKFDL